MTYQRQWFDGRDIYGMRIQQNGFMQPMPVPQPYFDLSGESLAEESEIAYWKGLFPEKMKKIQECVDSECDKLDYEGSMIYDEYPDKVTLQRVSQNILQVLMDDEMFKEDELETVDFSDEDELFESSQVRRFGPHRPPFPPRPPHGGGHHGGGNPFLSDIVDVLLFNEIFRRRRCRRDCKRRYWY